MPLPGADENASKDSSKKPTSISTCEFLLKPVPLSTYVTVLNRFAGLVKSIRTSTSGEGLATKFKLFAQSSFTPALAMSVGEALIKSDTDWKKNDDDDWDDEEEEGRV